MIQKNSYIYLLNNLKQITYLSLTKPCLAVAYLSIGLSGVKNLLYSFFPQLSRKVEVKNTLESPKLLRGGEREVLPEKKTKETAAEKPLPPQPAIYR